jgi:CBS domain-containing protein
VLGQLQRVTLEQVPLDPLAAVDLADPLAAVLDRVAERGVGDVVVVDGEEGGRYAGMIRASDLQTALWQREAVPLLAVADLARPDVRPVRTTDDLATVLDALSRHDVARLPVCLPVAPDRVIGTVTRVAILRRFQQGQS